MKRLLVMLAACDGSAPVVHMPGAAHLFVVDDIQVSSNNEESREDGLDLNGDGAYDNQFGMILGTLAGTVQLDVRGATSEAVKIGSIGSEIEIDADSLADEDDAAFVLDGHLLYGAIEKGRLLAGPGDVVMRIGWPDRAPIELPLAGARAKFTVNADGTLTGVVGGGIALAEVHDVLAPAFVETGNAALARDCSPACACTTSSPGSYYAEMVAAGTCTLTVEGVLANELVAALTVPDLHVDGSDQISTGARFTAHPR